LVDILILFSYAYILFKLRKYHKDLMGEYPDGSTEFEAVKSADKEVLLFFVLICQVVIVEIIYETTIRNFIYVRIISV